MTLNDFVLTTGKLDAGWSPHTTADGETLYVAHGDSEIGSEGPFFAAYTTHDLENWYG